MWSYIREADINATDDSVEQYGDPFIEQYGGAPSLRSQTKATPASPPKPPRASKKQTQARVLIDGLTKEQDTLLLTKSLILGGGTGSVPWRGLGERERELPH